LWAAESDPWTQRPTLYEATSWSASLAVLQRHRRHRPRCRGQFQLTSDAFLIL